MRRSLPHASPAWAATVGAVLKKLAIGLAVLLLLAAGVAGWLWHQATALPQWYTEGDASQFEGVAEHDDGPAPAPQWIALDEQGEQLPDASVPLAPEAPKPGSAPKGADSAPAPVLPPPRTRARKNSNAKRHELRGFHVRRGKDGKRKSNPAIKASRAVYEDGQLELGAIVDASKMPKKKLKARDRGRVERALKNFPGITERDVWIGIEDSPISVGGYLQLSPEADVRVGKLTYSLADAAKRVGMSPIELRMELNRELRRLGFVDPEA